MKQSIGEVLGIILEQAARGVIPIVASINSPPSVRVFIAGMEFSFYIDAGRLDYVEWVKRFGELLYDFDYEDAPLSYLTEGDWNSLASRLDPFIDWMQT